MGIAGDFRFFTNTVPFRHHEEFLEGMHSFGRDSFSPLAGLYCPYTVLLVGQAAARVSVAMLVLHAFHSG